MVATASFPQTERVASGVSYGEMFTELFKRPPVLGVLGLHVSHPRPLSSHPDNG